MYNGQPTAVVLVPIQQIRPTWTQLSEERDDSRRLVRLRLVLMLQEKPTALAARCTIEHAPPMACQIRCAGVATRFTDN